MKNTPMSPIDARNAANKAADDFFAIGENASEQDFRAAFSELYKSKGIWQWMDASKYSTTILNILYFSMKYNELSTTLALLDELYPPYADACKYDYANKSKIHEAWASLWIEANDEAKAYDHLKRAAYYIFIDNVSYDNFEYFSFRDFTPYAQDDILNNTICLAHPATFNDPLDTILLRWNQYLCDTAADANQKRLRLLYKKVYDHIKVRCFVRNDKLPRNVSIKDDVPTVKAQNIEDVNPLMWAHYANYHKGFCIKYKLPSRIVNNQDEATLTWTRIGDISYQPDMKLSEKDGFTVLDVLFAKHNVWEYEKEVRIVHYDPNDTSDFKTIAIPEDSIQEIYLGLRCSDENKDKMKLLLRNRNIRLYQMKVDPTDSYKMIKERIM